MSIADERTLEQRLMAQRVFAAADPRRTLVAFYLIDDEPKTESGLKTRLWEDYGEIAGLLQPWSSGHRNLGSMCENSISSIGLAESSEMVLPHPIRGTHTATAWENSDLAESLMDYVLFIQNAANGLETSSYALFTHLSGYVPPQERLQAPLNKARIILELARLANYEAGSKIRMRDVEKATGLVRNKIQGHLEQFEVAGLVALGTYPSLEEGKNFYRWISPNPPPKFPRTFEHHFLKLGRVAAKLYEARFSDPIGTSGFSPSMFANRKLAYYTIRKLVKMGFVEEGTRYYFRPVTVNKLGIDVAVQIVGRVFGAIIGDTEDIEAVRQGASEFRSNERQGLLAMVKHYVAASKTI